MNFSDFKIGWRLLVRDRVHSAVVLLGLSVGFAIFFLLLGFVRFSFTYDRGWAKPEQVFVLKQRLNLLDRPEWMELVPLPLKGPLAHSGAVSASTILVQSDGSVRIGDRVLSVSAYAAEPGFADVFGVAALQGDLAATLQRPDSVALTKVAAQRIFGETSSVGQTLLLSGKPFKVTALLPNPPANSTVQYDLLVAVNNVAWSPEIRDERLGNWAALGGKVYFRLADGASKEDLQRQLQDALDHSPARSQLPPEMLSRLGGRNFMDIRVGHLTDAYFDRDVAGQAGSEVRGDRRLVLGVLAVSGLILLLAAANYVNLATVRTMKRQREIAIRKVLGASPRRLVGQFIAESMLATGIATLFGIGLAVLAMPAFSAMINREVAGMVTVSAVICSLLIGLAVGALAGLHPAWTALKVAPSAVLAGRGNVETSKGAFIRRTLTVAQFGTAMALTGFTLAVQWQISFATHLDPGFEERRYLCIDLNDPLPNPPDRAFRDKVAQIRGVEGVADAMDSVGRAGAFSDSELVSDRSDGSRVTLHGAGVGADFFNVFRVHPLAGRTFAPGTDHEEKFGRVVLNATAARMLGYGSPAAAIGNVLQIKNEDQGREIIGVVPDDLLQSARSAAQPLMYQVSDGTMVLILRVQEGRMGEVRDAVEKAWRGVFPDSVLRMDTEAAYFSLRYAEDERLAQVLLIATAVSISLAAFGIYVLSAYTVQRRSLEIVLRKLYGARQTDVARLIFKEFLVLVAIAAVMALPFSFVAVQRYLAGFASAAPIGVWTVAGALIGALLLAFLATLRHVLQAMKMAPSEALRP